MRDKSFPNPSQDGTILNQVLNGVVLISAREKLIREKLMQFEDGDEVDLDLGCVFPPTTSGLWPMSSPTGNMSGKQKGQKK